MEKNHTQANLHRKAAERNPKRNPWLLEETDGLEVDRKHAMRYGSRRESLISRLESKSERRDNGCLEWTGWKDKKGYGEISIASYPYMAHRASYALHVGPIPHGVKVLHKCDNPSCINPEHLFLGSHQDNVADCVKKRRHTYGERQWKAVVTEDDVLKIRAINPHRNGPIMIKTVAKSYGVTPKQISRIVKRTSWRHVP